MSEWTSLSCKSETKTRLQEIQGEDESQDEVLNRALDALGGQEYKQNNDLSAGLTREEVEEIAEREIKAIERNTELLKDMDVVSRNQQVIKRIDDLETELKTHLERELRQ